MTEPEAEVVARLQKVERVHSRQTGPDLYEVVILNRDAVADDMKLVPLTALQAAIAEKDAARETIREMSLFARDKPVDEALRSFGIKFGVAAMMNHEDNVEGLVAEIQRDALDTFALLARPYLNRAIAAEALNDTLQAKIEVLEGVTGDRT